MARDEVTANYTGLDGLEHIGHDGKLHARFAPDKRKAIEAVIRRSKQEASGENSQGTMPGRETRPFSPGDIVTMFHTARETIE